MIGGWPGRGPGSFGRIGVNVYSLRSLPEAGTVKRPPARSNLQRIELEHRRSNRIEAYLKAGSGCGSATDGATPAARHKMATAVDTRIISDVTKVVEI